MDSPLKDALDRWRNSNSEVTVESGDDGFYELKWKRAAGSDYGYIDVYPADSVGEIVFVQHGMFSDPNDRDQRGVNRVRCSEIESHLTNLKIAVDNAKRVSKWAYSPQIGIGKVVSLKFR